MIALIVARVRHDIEHHAAWYSLILMSAATLAFDILRERERVRSMLAALEIDLTANLGTIAERMTILRQSEHDAHTTITDDDVRDITEGHYRG